MPREQELKFGPKMEQYFSNVEQMSRKRVEVSVGSGNQELQQIAAELEYGLAGGAEQPFMRPATARILRGMKGLLQDGGVDAVRDQLDFELRAFITDNVEDVELAEELCRSLVVRVVG